MTTKGHDDDMVVTGSDGGRRNPFPPWLLCGFVGVSPDLDHPLAVILKGLPLTLYNIRFHSGRPLHLYLLSAMWLFVGVYGACLVGLFGPAIRAVLEDKGEGG